jgi:hypothetical protein
VESTERPSTSLTLERFAARPVLLIAAALFVLEMALAEQSEHDSCRRDRHDSKQVHPRDESQR